MGGIGMKVGSGGDGVGDGGTGVEVDVGPRFIGVRDAVGIGDGREVPVDEHAVKYIAVKSNHNHLAFGAKTCRSPLDIFQSWGLFLVLLKGKLMFHEPWCRTILMG
jgi:hypothetical protein